MNRIRDGASAVVKLSAAVLMVMVIGVACTNSPRTGDVERPPDAEETAVAEEMVAPSTEGIADVPPAMESQSLEKRLLRREAILKSLTETGRQGTRGRLVFENSDFSVAVFESSQDKWQTAQDLVDAVDSAAWFMWFECQSPIVADHCNQGFDVIKRCAPGDICYIVDGDNYQKYVCVENDPNGTNERDNMYLSSGYNFMRENDPGYLYMYTCNEEGDAYHITVVTWVPVEEEE